MRKIFGQGSTPRAGPLECADIVTRCYHVFGGHLDKLEKRFISAQQLLEDSFELGARILASDFRPNFIVGVWRGGTPVGIAVQELLEYAGVRTDHIAIRTSLYKGMDNRGERVRVHGLNYILKNIRRSDRLLLVDDVFDSGMSIDAIIEQLQTTCRRNLPEELRIATAYYKPGNNLTKRVPDFFVHETDAWLVFPHEIRGLTEEEVAKHKPVVSRIMRSYKHEHA